MFRRDLLIGGAAIVAGSGSFAESLYPDRPVRIVSPFPPGGSADLLARTLAAQMGRPTGRQFIVENRSGAAGNLGSNAVAKSPKDGYTLLMGSLPSQAINMSLYRKMPYDTLQDFDAISMVAHLQPVLTVNPNVHAKTLAELIAHAKSDPKALKYASGGSGNSGHIAMEWLKSLAGFDALHVPYKGDGPAMTDLLGGQVDMQFTLLPVSLQHIQSGKLRALAVAGPRRSALLPDTPTIKELGFPQFSYTSWVCLMAPAGTPADVLSYLNAACRKAVDGSEFQSRMTGMGAEPESSSSEELTTFLKAEIKKWGALVRASGAVAD